MALPLTGVRILELTTFLAGPFAMMLLGDLGAEVIKIEDPSHPDIARITPPHFLGGESIYFLSLNRNKKSIAINLKQKEGLEVFYDLVKTADVVFDNFRAGTTKKLKIDHSILAAIKPDIITCSLSGFGQTGPLSDRPGYDYLMQGLSGLMSLTGEPGSPPQKTGISVVDHVGGMYAAMSILASLMQRERTGQGQASDVALLDSIISLFTYVGAYYLNTGEVPTKIAASAHPSFVPAQNFETADGYLVLMPITEKFWRSTCSAIGRPQLAVDPKFDSVAGRLKHKQELLDLLCPLFKSMPSAYWLERLGREGVPCSPIHDLAQGLEHPQVVARDMVVEITHPTAGKFRAIGNPMKMPGTHPVYGAPARLGEHTELLLSGLAGYSKARIDELREKAAIG